MCMARWLSASKAYSECLAGGGGARAERERLFSILFVENPITTVLSLILVKQ